MHTNRCRRYANSLSWVRCPARPSTKPINLRVPAAFSRAKTARVLGIDVQSELLDIADKVIE
jgi:hypothetical protein